jgi:uncharacterized protein YjbJ (UPF0337 family)
MKQSAKDEIKGNLQAATGTIKETVGRVTHNPNLTAQGQNEESPVRSKAKSGRSRRGWRSRGT